MPGRAVPRVVLLGATGYTGRLAAAALAGRHRPLLLAGRDPARLDRVRREVAPGAELAVVDLAAGTGSLVGAMRPGDVLLSTVGPFLRLGLPVARRAAERGWAYLDSTGEPPFVRRVHDELATLATATGARLLPAAGYDYVPGHLAAGLALRDAGPTATAVRVGYFVRGGSASSGTLASAAGVVLQRGYAWRGGRLVAEQPGRSVGSYRVGGRERQGISIAGSEHLFLPATFPRLRDVEVHLGWAGRWSVVAGPAVLALGTAARLPAAGAAVDAVTRRVLPGSQGGPTPEQRQRSSSLVVADALDARGEPLAHVELTGPDPYDLTAGLLAELAAALLNGDVAPTGVLGPIDALGGVDQLAARCERAGLRRTG